MDSFSARSYKNKLDAIFTRYPSVQNVPFGDSYKPGLDHMERFSAILGNPHGKYRTIHVAGTNGKGSVASMLASALSAAGLRTGLYTSPHIEDFRERARILVPERVEGPVLVPEEYVYDFLCTYEKDMDELDLSFFEITTGLAFKWFADEQVDVAVIEVGLGGRLDSTNIITPDLSVVTSIALDHCALLGDTLQAIAGEKSGIFKPGVPALVGEYLPETRPVFEEKAKELGCPLVFAQDAELSMAGRFEGILAGMDLKGAYQAKNLRTVLAAVDILKEDDFYSGLGDEGRVAEALVHTAERAGFHGRWERLSENPPVLADIGHNPAALKENFAQLEKMLQSGECSGLVILYAVMADKDLEGIMPLMPEDATYIFTSPGTRRALPEEKLTAAYKDFCAREGRPVEKVFGFPSVREALEKAFSLAKEGNSLIYVGGSTYLVSEVVGILQSS
ncbi:MAG: bifunctional folylpolyglutamate synthase/dihydrofolate synthase [Bacteroidales bacterium]|nr:bifunctional folylpolyglutamate synthase/dihydrofolate synthase [Bacteroidales bacterium]